MNFSAVCLQVLQSKKVSGEKVDGDDLILFREAMQDVKPLAKTGRITQPDLGRPPVFQPNVVVSPDIRNTFSDCLQPDLAESDDWSFARPGLQRNTLRKLRRGNWRVQDELDLHGLNRDEARQLLMMFLDRSIARWFRCVRIIHGRGLNSKNRKSILKILTGNWLMQHSDVLAFCQALPGHGGSGAILVLLRNTGK